MDLADQILNRLGTLEPVSLKLEDESDLHLGHAGWKPGGSHFRVTIVSAKFAGKTRLQRHRLVYQTLGPLMKGEIHALAVNALTPDEL